MKLSVRGRLCGMAVMACAATAQAGNPWTFVSLPDTQFYSDTAPSPDLLPFFIDQTQWIVDNQAALDIRYVGHLGDVVQNGQNISEWDRSRQALDLLIDNQIPHGVNMGNHDDIEPADLQPGQSYTDNYLQYYGPTVYADAGATYIQHSPSGLSNYSIVQGDKYEFLFLNMMIDFPDAEVAWARQVLEANRDKPTVISTHRHLYDVRLDAGRYGSNLVLPPLIDAPGVPFLDPNDQPLPGTDPMPFDDPKNWLTGEQFFNEVVADYPNIMMIQAGHYHSEYTQQIGVNSAGLPVWELLSDYQDSRNGGDGWLRLYEVDEHAGTITVRTYSPSLDRYRTTLDHFVESISLVFRQGPTIEAQLGLPAGTVANVILPQLKADVVPNYDTIANHPDWDPVYYQQLLEDLFGGAANVPVELGDITDWEGLWLASFAADPLNPTDYAPGRRSPEFVISFENGINAYVPEPATAALLALGGLLMLRRRDA
jgi:hypothetical protein